VSARIAFTLFTHPICIGCQEAHARLEQFAAEHPEVQFEVRSLAGRSGKELAKQWRGNAVPTLIVGNDPDARVTGVPSRETLDELLRAEMDRPES